MKTMAPPGRPALLVGLLLVTCGSPAPDDTNSSTAEPTPPGAYAPPPSAFQRTDAAASTERFGVGRAALPDEIALVDIDVMPDGTGLPAGEGTAAEGEAIYAARCASCHGAEGGTPVPGGGVLVIEGDEQAFVAGDDPDAYARRTVGNYWPYATTLFDYVRRAMPLDRPGSLTNDEVYATVAWILWKNQLVGREEILDPTTLPRIEMPARDRFVPDDRRGGAEVR